MGFKQKLTTKHPRFLAFTGVATPEGPNLFTVSQQHMRGSAILSNARESLDGSFAPRLKENVMTDQGNAFEFPVLVAASVETASIVLAHKSVASDETCHPEGVRRPLAQEVHYLGLLLGLQFFDHQRLALCECESGQVQSAVVDFSVPIHCLSSIHFALSVVVPSVQSQMTLTSSMTAFLSVQRVRFEFGQHRARQVTGYRSKR